MIDKKTLTLTSIIVLLISASFGFVSENYCDSYSCQDLIDMFAVPIAYLSLALLVTLTIAYRLPQKTFDSWWKFTRVYIPLSFFLILITPGGPSGGLINIDAELVTWWLSGIFLFVSIVLIMVKSRQ